ncbi:MULTISPECIES: DUF3180 family protein [Kocuria]|uniref:DUF3180 domain-containing protein n=2 Tax=Kocuria flava TaxID=446860 RepID=A0ABQ0X587_9MICC|nr:MULTISPECIES: DUF3180 family protein [Kocuria]MCD1145926.1 DUF3180 family protein [Kocuria sp. LUK]GEO92607.1 hypothetical protein KFL01_19130 [Kocuria flava]
MHVLTVPALLMCAAAAGAVGWSANRVSTGAGGPLLVLPWASLAACAAVAVVLLVLGLRVRRYQEGRRPERFEPVVAARTAAGAQAVAWAGAVLAGWHATIALEQLTLVGLRSEQGPLWASLAHTGAGLVLVVVGWVVEGFCKLPPDDPDAEEAAEYGRGRDKELPEGEGGYARGIPPRPREGPGGAG